MYTWDKIITNKLIDKTNDFFKKYDISKNCDNINEGIQIITDSLCNTQYPDLQNKAGKFDIETKKIVLRDSKVTQRLFLHEYVHKKSVKHRLCRKDYLGIESNSNFRNLNEAITEKITCEILDLPETEQALHPYSSMFIAIDELTKLIPWHKIVQSYFSNDIKIYKKTLGKDLIPFLNDVDTLLKNYPALYPNDKNKLQAYQKAHNDIIRIIRYNSAMLFQVPQKYQASDRR